MNDIIWSPGVKLEDIEKQVILKAFRYFGNNKTATAISLGITTKTLNSKLDRYALEATREAQAREDDLQRRKADLDRARGLVSAVAVKAV